MKRVKLIIEYDGSHYHGFQFQDNAHSVQEELERVLSKVCGEKIKVSASGRTDAGVHALGQVVAFNTASSIPGDRFIYALNSFLAEDVRVLASEEVAKDFHPRFHACNKHYAYYIYRLSTRKAFLSPYAYCYDMPLDLEEMTKAASFFIGRHNFKAFCSSGSNAGKFERTVISSSLSIHSSYLRFDIEANAFLYNMVRIIVGTLIEVGRGRIKAIDIADIIASQERKRAGATAPPQGLYLVNVNYSS